MPHRPVSATKRAQAAKSQGTFSKKSGLVTSMGKRIFARNKLHSRTTQCCQKLWKDK